MTSVIIFCENREEQLGRLDSHRRPPQRGRDRVELWPYADNGLVVRDPRRVSETKNENVKVEFDIGQVEIENAEIVEVNMGQ